MQQLPAALYRARELGEIDRRAAGYGLRSVLLMERAGQAAFHAIRTRWPIAERWLIYAGAGNNGGDGYVVARHARRAGFDTVVAALKPPRGGSPAAEAAVAYRKSGGKVVSIAQAKTATPDIVVDALFGTGLGRAPEGEAAQAIEAMNRAAAPVAAIDLPSGLVADTGAAPGAAVRAEITVSFIALKLGLFTGVGPALTGRLVFEDLGVPAVAAEGLPVLAWRIEEDLLAKALPRRPRIAHKGLYGHVLVVGGDLGTGGAARLAGEAALRVGAGLVSLVTRPEHVAGVIAGRPELMAHPSADGSLPRDVAKRATVIALGPGLGRGAWGRRLWTSALGRKLPSVIDADGLNILAISPRQGENWILTPHPGEAARLLGCSVAEVEQDRPAAVAGLAERFRAVAVLKGAGTLIAEPGESALALCDRGNPGMASAGMGDALTGIIAGLLAQRLAPGVAARLGVWLHGRVGDRAASTGERGLVAGDLIAELRSLVNP